MIGAEALIYFNENNDQSPGSFRLSPKGRSALYTTSTVYIIVASCALRVLKCLVRIEPTTTEVIDHFTYQTVPSFNSGSCSNCVAYYPNLYYHLDIYNHRVSPPRQCKLFVPFSLSIWFDHTSAIIFLQPIDFQVCLPEIVACVIFPFTMQNSSCLNEIVCFRGIY
jgi:hypothetical protein